MSRGETVYETNFCPGCGAYSGETFEILSEGENPPDSEIVRCTGCGWVGFWNECRKERSKR